MLRILSLITFCLLLAPTTKTASAAKADALLDISNNQRISIIGNTLAERLQHDGWMETYIQTRFPDRKLVFRNLGFSADAVTERLRVDGFGSPDDWLGRTKADVVFAFFGFSESFAGEEGVDKFQEDLAKMIGDMRKKKYNGKTAPTIVLFSPIAHENLKNPNLPDGGANNERLKLYTDAMAEVAQQTDTVFVDLFTPTQQAFDKAAKPLTINGIHLNNNGNRVLAEIIDAALFPGKAVQRSDDQMEKLRATVADEHPLVRLEAVRACSFFKTIKAAEIALSSLEKPQDNYLKFTLSSTLKTLQKYND